MPHQQNSRLGQILLTKGLITRSQLDEAITLQLTKKQRLGEILIAQGLISERQLKKALKKQSNLRVAATLVAALLSPFQMASADIQRLQAPHSISRQEAPRGLKPLTDMELSSVSARGLDDVLQSLFLQAENGDGLSTIKQLSRLVMPVLDSLEAETSFQDVKYDTQHMSSTISPDGTVEVRLPSSIGELRFDNIRVAGAPRNQSFGSLHLQDIDLSQASLKISLRR
ncbi:hypothetical protein [Pseudomonas indica]|uniref:hypothetical protein n=1 Tax=Pseudomonas indica TaxID=137658 RepID=UPI000BAB5CA0|nr:hypothetical protein [Pseudomonas indica]MBU3057647.1 hypothetical protein [Pseudomonas indica]PAU57994.1 hypothetical protein BZL42_13545 [Pseudomonas indica]